MNTHIRQRDLRVVYPHTRPKHLRIEPRKSHVKKLQYISGAHKVLWIASVLLSTTLCAWQLAICTDKYFAQPIGTAVTIESFNQYTTPGLVICPFNGEPTYDFSARFQPFCAVAEACKVLSWEDQQHLPFDNLSITLLDLWEPKNSKIKIEGVTRCHFAVNSTECKTGKWLKQTTVNTIGGSCQVLQSDLQWYFVGKTWVYWFKVHVTGNASHFLGDVYRATSTKTMFFGRTLIYPMLLNHLEVSETKFEYLNSSQNPCVTEDEEIECRNQWLNDQLQTSDVKCRWPFMNSTMPLCNSLFQVNQLGDKILNLFTSQRNSNCRRPCSMTTFSLGIERNGEGADATTIAVIYKINTRQIVSEYFAYPLSSLVSEVGGSIGLFLGFSLLSGLNYLHQVLSQVYTGKK